MSLEGRGAIVTGGARGMGKAIAERLAGEGVRVVICDIREPEANATVANIRSRGGAAEFVHCDLTDSASVRRMVSGARQQLGAVDILVNNAGWTSLKSFCDTDEPYWQRIIELNLYGALRVTHAVIPGMIERKSGVIVNVSSEASKGAAPGYVVYGACKAGINSMTRSLAAELAPHGIRVNCVSPGSIDTPLMAEETTPQTRAALIEHTPLKRFGEPREIAAAVLFLVSDEASYVTGQTLSVGGGVTMV